MKTEVSTLLGLKGQKIAFACVCLLIAGAGWGCKVRLDRIEAMDQEIVNYLSVPQQIVVWRLPATPGTKTPGKHAVARPAPAETPATGSAMLLP